MEKQLNLDNFQADQVEEMVDAWQIKQMAFITLTRKHCVTDLKNDFRKWLTSSTFQLCL